MTEQYPSADGQYQPQATVEQQTSDQQTAEYYQKYYQEYYEQYYQQQAAAGAFSSGEQSAADSAQADVKGKKRAIIAISISVSAAILIAVSPIAGIGSVRVKEILESGAFTGLIVWLVVGMLAGLAAFVAMQLAALSFRKGRPVGWGIAAVAVTVLAPVLGVVLGINGAGSQVEKMSDDVADLGYEQAAVALKELQDSGQDLVLNENGFADLMDAMRAEGIETEIIEDIVERLIDEGYIEIVD